MFWQFCAYLSTALRIPDGICTQSEWQIHSQQHSGDRNNANVRGRVVTTNEGHLLRSNWQRKSVRKLWHPVAHHRPATTTRRRKALSFSIPQNLGTHVALRITICRVAMVTTILHSFHYGLCCALACQHKPRSWADRTELRHCARDEHQRETADALRDQTSPTSWTNFLWRWRHCAAAAL